jgi:DNA polymerase I-like protein with 3'-5' exonuclease and polymerase domains
MLQVWRERKCVLLMQIHDAVIVQYPEEIEDEVIPKIIAQLRYPVELRHNRRLEIPYGCKTGWNWGEWSEANPNGLKSYKGGDKRRRIEEAEFVD